MLCKLRLPCPLVAGALLALALPACTPRADRPGGATPPVATGKMTRDDLQRRLQVAQLLLARAQTEVELGDLRYRDQISHAEAAFALAKRRQQSFTKFIAPSRLARAELGVQQAEDSLRTARQDAERGSAASRLQTLERELELRRDELRTLKEITLPLEQAELDLAAEEHKRAVLQTQRNNEAALIDRQVAVLNAEAEVTRLERELRYWTAQPAASQTSP